MIRFTEEQIFLVTGASSGIGKATALLLNRLGATVIGLGRNGQRLAQLAREASFPDRMFAEQKDLTEDLESLSGYVKTLKEKYGKLSGMAYCAGIGSLEPLRIVEYAQLQKVFAIHYFAPILLAKGFADKRNRKGSRPALVFIASTAGVYGLPGMTIYSGSKGALIASLRGIAKELAPAGLRVNCVSPSLIDTELANDIARDYNEGKYPFGFGKPGDVANCIAYLLSDAAQWITGQNYIVDCAAC